MKRKKRKRSRKVIIPPEQLKCPDCGRDLPSETVKMMRQLARKGIVLEENGRKVRVREVGFLMYCDDCLKIRRSLIRRFIRNIKKLFIN